MSGDELVVDVDKARAVVEDDGQCAICLELLYKPCCLPCGHVACFWCVFRAMDSFQDSACPLCRQSYRNLAHPCGKLHALLQLLCPVEFSRRASEVLEYEQQQGAQSVALPIATDVALGSGLSAIQDGSRACSERLAELLKCDHPTCTASLTSTAVVLNCGHVVCGDPCAADCATTRTIFPGPDAAPAEVATRTACPACGQVAASSAHAADGLVPCRLLSDVARAALGTGAAPPASPVRPARPPNNAHTGPAPAEPSRGQFVHFGVGCDACGCYPIRGARYTCHECQAACSMGFDLCGGCYETLSAADIRGRFNQHHTAAHELVEVQGQQSLLHMLQELNPELSIPDIVRLMRMQQDEAAEEEEARNTAAAMQQNDPPLPLFNLPGSDIQNAPPPDMGGHRWTVDLAADVQRLQGARAEREARQRDDRAVTFADRDGGDSAEVDLFGQGGANPAEALGLSIVEVAEIMSRMSARAMDVTHDYLPASQLTQLSDDEFNAVAGLLLNSRERMWAAELSTWIRAGEQGSPPPWPHAGGVTIDPDRRATADNRASLQVIDSSEQAQRYCRPRERVAWELARRLGRREVRSRPGTASVSEGTDSPRDPHLSRRQYMRQRRAEQARSAVERSVSGGDTDSEDDDDDDGRMLL
ncbi:unnamed protein product [Pedinophyceae sp. YPF-701]|nr:unnamed protein product [Pedinophyceae sp. YPF-701]